VRTIGAGRSKWWARRDAPSRTLDRSRASSGLDRRSNASFAIHLSKSQSPKSQIAQSRVRPHSRGAFRVRAVRNIALDNREGAGKAGCWPHPWSACKQKAGGVTTGTSRTTGLPCAMVLTVSFVLFPGTGLSCPRHPRSARCALWEFSASVGAPEPHDFSVRRSSARLAPLSRPSHPTANVRDDRERPSCRGRGMAEKVRVICPTRQARPHAACWRDGQMAHGMHARTARRAEMVDAR
jgi:hypothetical protein